MKTVVTMNNGVVESITEDGKIVYGSATAAGAASSAAAPAGGNGYESETAQILRHKQTSLSWRYANAAELTQDIVAKGFNKYRVYLKKTGGARTTLSKGTSPDDATGVTYVEQSDGSVVYETYLKEINGQATGARSDALPAYNDRAEMLNDLKAIGYQQIVKLDGVRVWPPADQAGFGPADEYVTTSGGGIIRGRDSGGFIPIETFDAPATK